MTDLERIKQFHDWLGDKYEFEESDDFEKRENISCNQRLTVGEANGWYWTYYFFQDGKLVNHYLSE